MFIKTLHLTKFLTKAAWQGLPFFYEIFFQCRTQQLITTKKVLQDRFVFWSSSKKLFSLFIFFLKVSLDSLLSCLNDDLTNDPSTSCVRGLSRVAVDDVLEGHLNVVGGGLGLLVVHVVTVGHGVDVAVRRI